MSDNSDNLVGECIIGGAVLGALAGLGLGIWACVEYVEPAFEATRGINESGAKALTAAVALGGGLVATTLGGALGGAFAFGVLGAFLNCCCCCYGMVSAISRQNQYSSAAPTLFRATMGSNNSEIRTNQPVATIV